eukprot:4879420-Prymnesium_polylepis.1
MGDLDLDGTIELAVGAPGDDGSPGVGPVTGAVYIVFLTPSGGYKADYIKLSNESGSVGGGLPLDGYGEFGRALAYLGDVDADGAVELAVGAPGVK